MIRWSDALLALLAAQPAEMTRVTIPLDELAARTPVPIPESAYARGYWWGHRRGTVGQRLWAAGWRVASVHEGVKPTITFVRLPSDTTA